MPTINLTLRRPHTGQQRVLAEAKRFNVVCMGRRWGKTSMGVNLAAETALAGKPVGWFAATNKLQSEAWRELVGALEPVTAHVSQQDRRLELITGGVIETWSLESTGYARGRKYGRAIIDEAAFARDLETAWNKSIRPTLTDFIGDAWILSTPWGLDYFWSMWMRGQEPDGTWKSWQMPSVTNPYLSPDEIESARADMPDLAFRQEYLAEFIDDGVGVFRKVRDAATGTLLDEPAPGREYGMGVDWGQHNDFTVLSLFDLQSGDLVAWDRFNQIEYAFQLARLRTLYDRFRPSVIVAESNSMGQPLVEALRQQDLPVVPFTTTNASKTNAIQALSLAFERGEITIPNNSVLIGELVGYRSERLPGGLMRYGAPPGMHDDCVMSLALGWSAVRRGGLIVAVA